MDKPEFCTTLYELNKKYPKYGFFRKAWGDDKGLTRIYWQGGTPELQYPKMEGFSECVQCMIVDYIFEWYERIQTKRKELDDRTNRIQFKEETVSSETPPSPEFVTPIDNTKPNWYSLSEFYPEYEFKWLFVEESVPEVFVWVHRRTGKGDCIFGVPSAWLYKAVAERMESVDQEVEGGH